MSKSKAKKRKDLDLSKKVMAQIEKKEVKMKPKVYFLVGSVLLGFGLTLVVLVSLFCTNLLFFRLRTQNPFAYLPQGRGGLRPFAILFPWQPLLLSVLSIGGGLSLLKQYDLSYKKPFKVLVIALIGGVLLLGLLLNLVRVNERVKRAKHLQRFYQPRPLPSPPRRLQPF